MGIFKRKTVITLEQIAEGVVWIPHMPNEMNKFALDSLIKVFEPSDDSNKTALEIEYTSFCFSLWWFKYIAYLQKIYADKINEFNVLVANGLNSYFKKIYPSDYFETISEIYNARVESYQNAYFSPNYSEDISELLFWHIGFSLISEEPCIYPVNLPVPKPLNFNIQGKILCAALIADLWKFIDKHIEGWQIL